MTSRSKLPKPLEQRTIHKIVEIKWHLIIYAISVGLIGLIYAIGASGILGR